MRRSNTINREPRSGVVTLEFILVAPVVFLTLIAIFEFGFLALTLHGGHAALIEGTRRGAELYPANYPLDLNGTSDNDIADQITEVMNEYLKIHGLEIVSTDNGFPDTDCANAQIVIERGDDVPLVRGDLVNFPTGYVCTPKGPDVDVDEIRVTLCFRLVDPGNPAGSGDPVPDWLSPYGFTLSDCMFEVSSRMTLE
ncbi:MAG: pilus assembly protein [Planctomycetaceae bacterium]|nr:pilus assembly protein [Planctomycetaceae bacterium]